MTISPRKRPGLLTRERALQRLRRRWQTFQQGFQPLGRGWQTLQRVLRPVLTQAERGTSSLELALVMPVLLTLIVGTVDFGRATMMGNMASEAAREGARVASVQVSWANATQGTVPSGVTTTVTAAARRHTGGLDQPLNVAVTTGVDASTLVGPWVQVTVTGTYRPVAASFLHLGNIPVRATSRMYLQ